MKRSLFCLIAVFPFFPCSVHAAAAVSSVEARQVRDTSAIILWHNEVPGTIPAPLTGQVEYGESAAYGSQTSVDPASFFHSISLAGLSPSTTYHYRLRVKDGQDNETLSADYTFATLDASPATGVTGISPNAAGNTVVNDDTVWQGITAVCGGNITVGNASRTVTFTIRDSSLTVKGGWSMGGNTPVNFSLINSLVIFKVQSGEPDLIDTGVIDGSRTMVVNDTMDLSKASRIEVRDSTIQGTDATHRAGGVVIRSGYTGYASPVTQHLVIMDNVTFAYMGGLTNAGYGYWALDARWWDSYSAEFAPGSSLTNLRFIADGKGIRMSGGKQLYYAYASSGACAFTDGTYYDHVYMDKVYEGLYEPDTGALVRNSWFDGTGTKFNFNTGSNGIFENNYVQYAAFNAGDAGGNGNIVRNNILYHTGIGSRKDYTQYLDNQIDSSGFEYGVNMGGLHQTADGNTVTGAVRYGFNVVPHPYTTLPAGWHTIRDNIVHDTQYGMRIGSSSNGTVEETDNTFINNTISSTTVGYGIAVCNSAHQLFVDTKIFHTVTYDIALTGSNNDIRFINTWYDPAKVYCSTAADIFLPYWYLDVKVRDANGDPAEGARVTVTNERDNVTYPAINVNGVNTSETVTDAAGGTPPPSDATRSLAVLDYAQNSSTAAAMTYTITAEKNGIRASVTGIDPDAGWYRADPAVPAHTVTVTLPVEIQTINAITGTIVYPNPYIKGKTPGKTIFFGNLPAGSVLRLYTIASDLLATLQHVTTSDGGSEEWDVTNVASGVYLYTISSSKGITRGKVCVVK
jgi:hypothetical protein